jgi:predicted nucleotide-binding protein
MYYHVLIETTEIVGKEGEYRKLSEFDEMDLNKIETRVIRPFLLKEEIHFDGCFLARSDIKRVLIKETKQPIEVLLALERSRDTSGWSGFLGREYILANQQYASDITNSSFDKIKALLATETASTNSIPITDSTKIFIVHGRDDLAKTEAARFIEKLGFSAIILHEQPNSGKTIIEKIEEYTNVRFALVLYTPCDIGGLVGEKTQKPRARQNVVFEHGYLIGKLGRPNVCALVTEGVECPSDISGVAYYPIDSHGAWRLLVAKELRNSGYPVDMNKIIDC